MTSTHIDISPDDQGHLVLSLRGDWSPDVEDVLINSVWDKLVLFGVTWSNYAPLVPFAKKIKWLVVPLGPDSSEGFEKLSALEIIELKDAPKPVIDFRNFADLKMLNVTWEKKRPGEYLAAHGLRTLSVHGVNSDDLSWLIHAELLEALKFRDGRLLSLTGVENLPRLKELRIENVKKLLNLAELKFLTGLQILDIDAPYITIENLGWLDSMPELHSLSLSCKVNEIDWVSIGKHKNLKSLIVTAGEGYALSDEEISRRLLAGGKTLESFKRFKSKAPGFAIELC